MVKTSQPSGIACHNEVSQNISVVTVVKRLELLVESSKRTFRRFALLKTGKSYDDEFL